MRCCNTSFSSVFVDFYVLWHAPETVYDELPQVVQLVTGGGGQFEVRPACGGGKDPLPGAQLMPWCGERTHVGGGQDYFLRLAMTQVCGVVPGARNGTNIWQLGYCCLVLSQ